MLSSECSPAAPLSPRLCVSIGHRCRLPGVEQDGHEHVAHDVHAGTGAGDDPIHSHDEGDGGEDDLIRQTGGRHLECFECRKLACLEVVHLVDEPLECRDGVAALLGSQLLIDGQSHGLGGIAHLAKSLLIGCRGGLVS